MQVITGKPRYVRGAYNNISVSGDWNHSLAASLKSIASEIELCTKDVQDIEVDRSDSFLEPIQAFGSIGYSIPSEGATDTYCLDFTVKANIEDAYDYSQNVQATAALLEALNEYVSKTLDYSLARCTINTNEDLDGFTLRAYFLKHITEGIK